MVLSSIASSFSGHRREQLFGFSPSSASFLGFRPLDRFSSENAILSEHIVNSFLLAFHLLSLLAGEIVGFACSICILSFAIHTHTHIYVIFLCVICLNRI